MSVRKAVRKAVRKVLPKEFRQKLKEQFKIKTEADEEKTTRTKAKISSIKSETVAIFSDNLNVIFENEKFSENTKISIRKRGKVEQEIIGGNYSSSKIIIPIDQKRRFARNRDYGGYRQIGRASCRERV